MLFLIKLHVKSIGFEHVILLERFHLKIRSSKVQNLGQGVDTTELKYLLYSLLKEILLLLLLFIQACLKQTNTEKQDYKNA